MSIGKGEQPQVREPGDALDRLIFVAVMTLLFAWAASQPGWGVLWLGALACAVQLIPAVRELKHAHAHWAERERREAELAKPSDRFNKGGGDTPDRGGSRDSW